MGGKAPDAFKKLVKIHTAIYNLACEELRAGNTIGAVDAKTAKLAASMGGNFKRAWALQLSELAESFFKLDAELQKGMCYVIHPWTEPSSGRGFHGHTVGNTCLVTGGEPEVVHKTPLEVMVI